MKHIFPPSPPRLDQGGRLRGTDRRRDWRTCPKPSTCSGSAAPARWRTGRKKTTQAIAELLHNAGVKFAVLGPEETCTGDPARRAGNEFLFQMLAQQNVEVLNSRSRAASRAQAQDRRHLPALLQHLANEYPQLGGDVRGRAPHAAARHAGARGRWSRSRRSPRTSPTTTRATWAGTTRSTRRRASSSPRCRACATSDDHWCRGICSCTRARDPSARARGGI